MPTIEEYFIFLLLGLCHSQDNMPKAFWIYSPHPPKFEGKPGPRGARARMNSPLCSPPLWAGLLGGRRALRPFGVNLKRVGKSLHRWNIYNTAKHFKNYHRITAFVSGKSVLDKTYRFLEDNNNNLFYFVVNNKWRHWWALDVKYLLTSRFFINESINIVDSCLYSLS